MNSILEPEHVEGAQSRELAEKLARIFIDANRIVISSQVYVLWELYLDAGGHWVVMFFKEEMRHIHSMDMGGLFRIYYDVKEHIADYIKDLDKPISRHMGNTFEDFRSYKRKVIEAVLKGDV